MHEYEDFLMHYGRSIDDGAPGVGSGRYPKGSGENPYQHAADLLSRFEALSKEGKTNKEIAEILGYFNKFKKPDIGMMQADVSNAKIEKRAAQAAQAIRLHEQGHGASEIARMMDIPSEATVRGWIKSNGEFKATQLQKTADIIKEYVDKNRYVDVGAGAEIALGVTSNRLKNAVNLLVTNGYNKETLTMKRMGTNHTFEMTILTPPDCTYEELSENRYKVVGLSDSGRTIDINNEVSNLGIKHPTAIDSKRIYIRYAEDGGKDKDGLIELRPGVEDISLGASHYSQVRISVDDSHYMKGMARYSDDIPDGYDIVFNTNKHAGTPMMSSDPDGKQVLKSMKSLKDKDGNVVGVDWDNPFGASITQKYYLGKDGKEHLSAVNVVQKHEEGDWKEWDKNLASQFLSKQPVALAARQLKLASDDAQQEFNDICALTNNTVKRKLLIDFADKCDAAAVELKAAPFPGQQTYVILPFPELKDNEIYAPSYADGTRVALIRYPHGGKFEIPELTVRNTGSPARNILGNAPDAVGINAHVAEILSGADFDGDTVTVIPLSDKVRIQTKRPLEALKDFDPKEAYPKYEGMKVISADNKQNEMGKVTNLITDMTLKGADDAEIARAVKHSMVIIDAEKHELDYKRSFEENGIEALKKKWQDNGKGGTGAGTIISRAKSPEQIPQRKDWTPSKSSIDPETGKKIFKDTGETYMVGQLKVKPSNSGLKEAKDGRTYYMVGRKRIYGNQEDLDNYNKQFEGIKFRSDGSVIVNKDYKNGGYYYLKTNKDTGRQERVHVTEDDFSTGIHEKTSLQETTKMASADDAYTLTSGGSRENYGYLIEKHYAEYANTMKGLGNAARKLWLETPGLKKNPAVVPEYKAEIESLDNKLAIAKAHSPLERQAQRIANETMYIKKQTNPDMSKEELKRYQSQAIQSARDKVGAKKKDVMINITDREWEAIQAGAISDSKLQDILNHADMDVVRQKATPRATRTITPTMQSLAKRMEASGYTQAQIADRLGISASSVYTIVSGKKGD